jgi:hypothetical protein
VVNLDRFYCIYIYIRPETEFVNKTVHHLHSACGTLLSYDIHFVVAHQVKNGELNRYCDKNYLIF